MTSSRALVDVATVAARVDDPSWVLVDCRFSLDDPAAGRSAWAQGTIGGAAYANLDTDLAGPVLPGKTGRHPLPSVERFAATLGAWGIGDAMQVVAFDDFGGAFASRLWWMLRWLGHDAVAVLDGGLPAWVAAGQPTTPGQPTSRTAQFVPRPRPDLLATAADVHTALDDPSQRLIDARGAARYSGENETRDPVAGHIPGAVSAPFTENLTEAKHFRSAQALRERFTEVADGRETIAYCGSGVTACHNLLAMAHAGLEPGRLFVGSWSEWITDPTRPRE